jgi:uncharacterized membrane protein YfcA
MLMILGLPTGEIAALAALLIAGGVLAGLLSGLLGVGGGGILVPVLYELLGVMEVPADIRMHMAVGTTFAIIIPTGLRSGVAHYRRGSLDTDLFRVLGPAVAAGVVIGLVIARYANSHAMQIVWVCSALLISSYQFLDKRHWRLGDDMPGPAVQAPVGIWVGVFATLMGVGGAAYLVPFMTLYGRPMHQAVGTSAAIGALIATPAMLGYMWAGLGANGLPAGSIGYVSLLGAALMIPSSVLAAPWGVRIAHGLSRRQLELGFGVFILLVAARFLAALLWQ